MEGIKLISSTSWLNALMPCLVDKEKEEVNPLLAFFYNPFNSFCMKKSLIP